MKKSLLASDIAESYSSIHSVVTVLGKAYGFEVDFFWQPHLGSTGKSLSDEEKVLVDSSNQQGVRLARAAKKKIHTIAARQEGLHDISDALNDYVGTVWVDKYGHLTPDGNRVIAEHILKRL